MKQVININFQGRVVPIEVSAFDMLKEYTESLNRFFAAEEGKEEIINDIENRIGELFQERLKEGATCITDDDVNAIIRSMGRPEDFEASESTSDAQNGNKEKQNASDESFTASQSAKRLYRDENNKVLGGVCSGISNYLNIDVVVVRVLFVIFFGVLFLPYLILWVAVPSSASTAIGSPRKKLYRDSDDKIIAGVCSGIGNYMGINPWIPRILFLLPFITFVFGWNTWALSDFPNFLRLGFSPGAVIIYIILWLVIPEAVTTTEKLEMKGEKVDMNTIRNSVMEEMKGVQQRAEKFGKEASAVAAEKGRIMGAEAGAAARRGARSLGDVIVFLFKVFAYLILGCIAFAFVVALFAFAIAAIGLFPMKDFVLTAGWQSVFAWGTLLFFIAAPIIAIITWLIRRLAKIKTRRKLLRLTFFGLWIIGLLCFISLVVSLGKDFRSTSTLKEEEVALVNPSINKLEISSLSPDQKFYRNRWFSIEPFADVDEDTAFVRNISVHIVKSPNDSFRVTMLKMVAGKTRRYADTLAALMNFNVIQQDSLLLIDKGIGITRTNKFRNQRVVLTVYVPVGKQIRVDPSVGWSQNVRFEGPWSDEWDVDFVDVERGWEQGVDYIMHSDGLYTLEGNPADTWSHPRRDRNKNNEYPERRNDDGYRYDQSQPADSVLQEGLRKQRRLEDSLQKEKEKLEMQLEKLKNKPSESTVLNTFTLQFYNPMLMMN